VDSTNHCYNELQVKLDVGGSLFATSKATLLTFANSFFHAMLSSKEFTPDPQDGAYFIDRFAFERRHVAKASFSLPVSFFSLLGTPNISV
jgi:hypothetical protein